MVKHGSTITYTGIPAGVDVNVFETNNMTGVTYQVTSNVNGAEAASDASLVNDANSTAVDVDTAFGAAIDEVQSVEIINTLLLISPTGVALRVAPFVLMMATGGLFLVFAHRRFGVEC